MKSLNKTQLITISAVVVLAFLLFIAPQTPSAKGLDTVTDKALTALVDEAKKKLSAQDLDEVTRLESGAGDARNADQKKKFLDEMVKKWTGAGRKDIAAIYRMHAAETENTPQAWAQSGDAFQNAARFAEPDNKAPLYQNAEKSYRESLKLDSSDLSIRTKLGTCIVEGSQYTGEMPMSGVRYLLDVLKKDSLNFEANLQLGFFSLTSQQFDKAIGRFEKVLKKDSTYVDAYVLLGDTYLQMNDKDKAVDYYTRYMHAVKDSAAAKEMEEHIKKLKNNINP